MARKLTIAELFEAKRERLSLTHICGNLHHPILVARDDISPADLVGHVNVIHPERLQVFGTPEIAWTQRTPERKMRQQLQDFIAACSPGLIVADGCEVPYFVQEECAKGNLPLFSTPQPAALVIDALRLYLSREFAETISLHGVFMDVLGLGVLLTGDSGVGKSELALELITRGHGLVADDVVEVSRLSPEALEGHCPELLMDFIEVRGLGLLNIRTVFGETACRRKMRLRLICHLQRPQAGVPQAARLPLDAQNETILGVPIRRVTIPVAAGRNLAVLVETAVRSTILQLRGIDCMQEFLDRQQQALEAGAGDI
ncbi:HPr(Ser) kinase/phosphatase [Denitratisoma oestradiolicum]|uniref:HPr kinase/phosphorylase n=1 Tax=Denitratisoma oestradiolicum TaxID=311182 RepID=A0A6S6Y616_9PROT|nr:HPr(Ser) kinase/phosphatase [Denitratisoma oestradiolicum]TWO80752.1 HPr kinase/phosphorylase [Denitratisoma oestradiolicum]CAB1370940.1 HPr kinase/phosphorylase [Denitratisoma oestradiolicum]